jgi:hypothetical protein
MQTLMKSMNGLPINLLYVSYLKHAPLTISASPILRTAHAACSSLTQGHSQLFPYPANPRSIPKTISTTCRSRSTAAQLSRSYKDSLHPQRFHSPTLHSTQTDLPITPRPH